MEDEEEKEHQFKLTLHCQAKSNGETFAARAVRDGIGVRDFEAAFL
jgi:hypothetical protein